jgi:sec-independent protein translocase protein TatC
MGKQQEKTAALPPHEPTEEDLIAGGKVMSVFDHLAELRGRIVRSIIAVAVFFFIAFGFADYILGFLKLPLMAVLPRDVNTLHFTGPLDVFLVNIKVAVLVAVVAACPVWLYQFWKFFEPALYPRERRYILPFIVISVALFFTGISFCFFVILPMTLEFLIQMGMEVGTPLITIKDYVSLLMLLIFGFGIVFEFPVLVVLLALLDLVELQTLKAYRRYVVVIIFVLAAVLTPSPDPLSMTALAIPVYFMYEASLVVIGLIKKREGTNAQA